ncbi:MAG: thioredoxin [Blautia producta]
MAMEFTSTNFTEEVLNSPIPVMVDFWATWCMPCKMLAPTLEELAEEANGAYKVGKVNVDAEPALAAQFGIMNIPTVLVFKNGQVVEKSVGLVQKSQLSDLLK